MESAFEIQIDQPRNLLRLLFRGRLTARRLMPYLPQLETALRKVHRGFSALTDFIEVKSIDLDCAPAFARMLDLFREHGAGRLIRVLPDASKDIGLNILAAIHLRGLVPTACYETMGEAERALVGPPTPA